ncbi:unnamed protein product, partial [Owenia fusiformis]
AVIHATSFLIALAIIAETLKCGLDIPIVIDVSCSISNENKTAMQQTIPNIAFQLNTLTGCGDYALESRMTVITFARELKLQWSLNAVDSCSSLERHLTGVDLLRPMGCNTKTSEAIKIAYQELVSSKRPN